MWGKAQQGRGAGGTSTLAHLSRAKGMHDQRDRGRLANGGEMLLQTVQSLC